VSPKNKGKFGKGKPQIEGTDEFVSGVNQFLNKLKPFAKQLVIGAVVVFVAVVAAVAYNMHRNKQEARATELYSDALDIYQQPVMSEQDAELLASLNLPNQDTLVTHTSVQARAAMALEPLETLQSEYGGTNAAKSARLLHAGALFDAGRYDEAAEMYAAFADSGALEAQRVAAREGVGYALEAKAFAIEDKAAQTAALERALAAFAKIQDKPDGLMRDYALYHQARVMQALDRRDEAIKLYNEVLDTQPATGLRREINNRLAVLDVPADGK
jgi:predicted negative regulator of RcsB-dependent stress response